MQFNFHCVSVIIMAPDERRGGARMGRTASGREVLEQAKACLAQARTVEELRQAQAVVLPLEFGLTLLQTAQAIGESLRVASREEQAIDIVLDQ